MQLVLIFVLGLLFGIIGGFMLSKKYWMKAGWALCALVVTKQIEDTLSEISDAMKEVDNIDTKV